LPLKIRITVGGDIILFISGQLCVLKRDCIVHGVYAIRDPSTGMSSHFLLTDV